MKIKGLYNITNIDADSFYKSLTETVLLLQEDKQDVEIQYQTNVIGDKIIVYNALVIGREREIEIF